MGARSLVLGSILVGSVLGGEASAQLTVDHRDADIGGNLDFVFRAPAGTVYVSILSLNEGPTCFPPNHPVGCIDVGLDLFWLSFALPGFFGTMPGSGEVVSSFSVPSDPLFDGLVINNQIVSLVNGKFTEKSNLCKVGFGWPDSWAHSVGSLVNDPFGIPGIDLGDGRVLLAGAMGANADQCEAYDMCRQAGSALAPLNQGRAGHTVTKLADGRVLVTGGADVNVTVLASAELYDPATDTWTTVGSMSTARAAHSASLLPDGRVLIAGGTDDLTDVLTAATNALKTTEYFDPVAGTFAAGPNLNRPHVLHTSVSLGNGDVLLCGGGTFTKIFGIPIPDLSNKAQVYSAAGGSWGGEVTMKAARVGASGILLADGRVLLAGGIGGTIASPSELSSSETYDSSTNVFTARGSMGSTRAGMAMVVMQVTDQVVVAGGGTGTLTSTPVVLDLVELFDPASGLFTTVAPMPEPRGGAAALLQPNRHALILGGVGAVSPAAIYRD
jgi:hypothetical protein